MGDWEDTFGCGVTAESVIDSINRDYLAEQRQEEREERLIRALRKKKFSTFQDASTWAKKNPGKSFKRSIDGNGFTEI